jgi:hypothetical protein
LSPPPFTQLIGTDCTITNTTTTTTSSSSGILSSIACEGTSVSAGTENFAAIDSERSGHRRHHRVRITFKPQYLIPSLTLPIDIIDVNVNDYLFSLSRPRGQSDEGQGLSQCFGDEQGSAKDLGKTALSNSKTQTFFLTFHSNNGIIDVAAAVAVAIGTIKGCDTLCSQISTSRP